MNLSNILLTIQKLRSNYNYSKVRKSQKHSSLTSILQKKLAYVYTSFWNGSFTLANFFFQFFFERMEVKKNSIFRFCDLCMVRRIYCCQPTTISSSLPFHLLYQWVTLYTAYRLTNRRNGKWTFGTLQSSRPLSFDVVRLPDVTRVDYSYVI